MAQHFLLRKRGRVGRVMLTLTAVVGMFLATAPPAGAAITPTVTATTMAGAMAAPETTVTGASFITNSAPTANATADTPLAGFPTNGNTYAIMTTGNATKAAGTVNPSDTGTNNGGGNVRGNTDQDVSILKVDLTVPQGANCLRFDFKFLSEEYPNYLNQTYNDSFIAEMDQSTWTTNDSAISAPRNIAFDTSGNPISINATGAASMSAANAVGTSYGGATPTLTAATTVTPGAHSLYLSIFDQGDQLYDSAAFIDNLVVGYSPNPGATCAPGAQVKTYNVALSPATHDAVTGTSHTVTATVTGLDGADVPAGSAVYFTIAGANPTTSPVKATVDAAGTASYTYTGANPGTDTIAACYDSDDDGTCGTGEPIASATATWNLPPNQPPVNDAGGPYTGVKNQPITLTGTASDPDSDPVTTTWTADGPGACTFSDASALDSTVSCDTPGDYTLTISTTDGTDTVTDTAQLTITNQPPVTDAGGPYTGVKNQPVTLAGTASDPDSDPVTTTWTVDGPGICTFSDAAAFNSTISCDTAGSYTLTITTTDGTDTVTDHAVLAIGVQPVVALIADPPAEGTSLPQTGFPFGVGVGGASLLLLGGYVLMLAGRRKNRTR